MTRSAPILLAGFCAGLALLTGCSGGTSDTAGGAAANSRDGATANLPGRAKNAPAAAGLAVGSRASASGAGTSASGAGTASDETARLAPDLIVTASMTVSVRGSVGRAADRAEAIAASAGGRTDSDDRSSVRSRHARPSADLSLRVPNSHVSSVLDRLAGLGRETSRQLSTRDVTAQVVDVGSRVASARRAIASLNQLYQRATRVRDVISVETSLAAREAALESLEARQRALAGSTALATIALSLTGRPTAAPAPVHHSDHGGFVGGLQHGWHAFAVSASALATTVGAVLPFAVVLLVLGAFALVTRRRLRGTPQPTPNTDG